MYGLSTLGDSDLGQQLTIEGVDLQGIASFSSKKLPLALESTSVRRGRVI